MTELDQIQAVKVLWPNEDAHRLGKDAELVKIAHDDACWHLDCRFPPVWMCAVTTHLPPSPSLHTTVWESGRKTGKRVAMLHVCRHVRFTTLTLDVH